RLIPPTIELKGLTVHLQSAFKLAGTLEELASTGKVTPFEEITPTYYLAAAPSAEGLELKNSDKRVGLTTREARKWANIISSELERLNARQVERGRVRTVVVDDGDGRWILQWGDEVFLSNEALARPSARSLVESGFTGHSIARQTKEFLLFL